MAITIATRRSLLALWQTRHVVDLLKQHCGLDSNLLELLTRSDEKLDRSLAAIGGKGLFYMLHDCDIQPPLSRRQRTFLHKLLNI